MMVVVTIGGRGSPGGLRMTPLDADGMLNLAWSVVVHTIGVEIEIDTGSSPSVLTPSRHSPASTRRRV